MPPGPTRLRDRAAPRARVLLAAGTLILLVILGIYLLYLLPYQDMPGWAAAVGQRVAALGWYGPLLFGLITAVATAVGVPRLLMTGVAAMLFGVFWGLLCSQLGALSGAFVVFLLARWSGREVGLDRWRRLRRFQGLLSEQGIIPVLLIRQLPLSSFFINLLLGLTEVRPRDFMVGSLLGFLPEAIPVALISAGLVQSSVGESLGYILVGLVLLLAFWLLLRWFRQSSAVRAGNRRIESELGEGDS